ncbi:MAG TPA: lipoprotein insertase outer membrane protein LolB [Burkholderiales bacterium]|nr:lipoprotein insertase outer membrane protein LolB [Burkholderiales bacterium]
MSRTRTALLCGLVLSACATVPRAPSVVDPAQVSAFDLTGRVNVRVESKGYPGRIHWQHTPSADDVWLYSPVGSTVARMRQDASGALLITSDGKEYRAADIKLLAREVLGWELPLGGLQYWVRGLPWPALDAAQQEYDAAGRPRLLSQGGWQVAYLDWAPAGVSGLPSLLDLSGEGLHMRLVIEKWKVDDSEARR